jgi:cytochrome P450
MSSAAATAFADVRDPYGLMTRELFENPHPLYHLLRHSEPVYWSELFGSWILTRYVDVAATFRDTAHLSSGMRRAAGTSRLTPALRARLAPIDRFLSSWVLNTDDPEHHRLRSAITKRFTPQVLVARGRIAAAAERLADEVEAGGPRFEFVEDFARPFLLLLIEELFGFPREAHQQHRKWSRSMSRFFEIGPAEPAIVDEMAATIADFMAFMRELAAAHRAQPPDNLLGGLLRADEEGAFASEEQFLSTCILVLFASHDSTTNFLGNAMLTLLSHGDQLALLRNDYSLMRAAVDEMLRFESPVMRQDRIARVDFELGGRRIQQGQRVILGIGAANRDPAMFANPDIFDIRRKNANRHLTFGLGAHGCFGGALATMQTEVAFPILLQRFPQLRLASGDRWVWREHFNFRGLRRLPLAW